MLQQQEHRRSSMGDRPFEVEAQKKSQDYEDLNRFFGDEGEYKITFDQYNRYRQLVKKDGDQTVQYFLYVYPDGNFDVLTGSQYVAQIKKDNPGKKLETIRTSLYNSGILDKTGYATKDNNALATAILKAGSTQSVDEVDGFLANKDTALTPFFDWATTRPSAGVGGPTKSRTETTEVDAAEMINNYTQQLLDRPATEEEKKLFFQKIKSAEKLAIVTRKEVGGVEVTSGSRLEDADYREIAFDTLRKSVSSLTDEEIGKGTGALSQSVSSLKEFATQYGINLSNREAFNQVMNGMVEGGTLTTGKLDSQQQAIKNMAKTFYPSMANIIDNGGTVSAVADQFATAMSNILEIPSQSINVFDKRIQKALANNGKPGVMTQTEFEVMLRNEPEWAKTKNAREEAAGYATSILQSFGLMA
jgi:hypothetical protein